MGKQETEQHLGLTIAVLSLLSLGLNRQWEGVIFKEREDCLERVSNRRQEL